MCPCVPSHGCVPSNLENYPLSARVIRDLLMGDGGWRLGSIVTAWRTRQSGVWHGIVRFADAPKSHA
jgi:hypothetical protein